MSKRDTVIHLVAGGVAGTAGAVVTCPLEVVKTRLQSSNPVFGNQGSHGLPLSSTSSAGIAKPTGKVPSSFTAASDRHVRQRTRNLSTCVSCGRNAQILSVAHHSQQPSTANTTPRLGLVQCLR